MRLKGGKLLLDLTQKNFIQEDFTNKLSDDEFECVIKKGLNLLIKGGSISFIVDVSWNTFIIDNDGEIEYMQQVFYDDSRSAIYAISLKTSSKELSLISF